MSWSIADVFKGTIVYLQPKLIKEDFNEFEVKSGKRKKVRIYTVFNILVIELLRLNIFENSIQDRKVSKEKYCLSALRRDSQ